MPLTPFVPIQLDHSSARADRVTVVTERRVQVNKRIYNFGIADVHIFCASKYS